MKQVTGNKISPVIASNSILSIRLSPDGFYFVVVAGGGGGSGLGRAGGKVVGSGAIGFNGGSDQAVSGFYAANGFLKYEYRDVIVCIDTNRSVIIPAQEADIDPRESLELCGIVAREGEETVRSEAVNDICAAMVVGSDIFGFLKDSYAGKLRLVHPLSRVVAGKFAKPVIRVNYTASFVNVALFAGTLMAAESVPYHNDEEVVYYLHKMAGNFPEVKKFLIVVSGSDAKKHKRKLSKYFSCSVEKLEPYQCV